MIHESISNERELSLVNKVPSGIREKEASVEKRVDQTTVAANNTINTQVSPQSLSSQSPVTSVVSSLYKNLDEE